MIDNINLIKLDNKEIEELERHSLFDSSKSNKQLELMTDIIEFNKQSVTKDFFIYFCLKYKNKCIDEKTKNKLEVNLRVRKSRLNNYIKKFKLEIDKQYHILKIEVSLFQNLSNELILMLGNKKISSVKIFDSYQEENKNKILNKKLSIIFKNMLKFERSIHIISIFDNEDTKNFYKGLLTTYETFNNNSFLEILYLRKPFVQSSSMIYALITDEDNNDYIFYYEAITDWSVVTPVNRNLEFTIKFNQLLERRFNFYLNEKMLKETNEIIRVSLDLFQDSFEYKTKNIIEDIKELLVSQITNQGTIKREINLLIHKLKKIKLAFPSAYNAQYTIFYHIKLVEIILLIKANNSLPHTKNVLKQCIESGLSQKLYYEIKNEIVGDKFFITEDEIIKLDFKPLQKKLLFDDRYNHKSISEIFSDYLWNTQSQIIIAFNDILSHSDKSCILIGTLIAEQSEDDKMWLVNNPKYIKIITRIIFKTYYNINYTLKVNLEKNEKNDLSKIKFYDENIMSNMQKYLKKGS